jgi:pyruvate, orthophosphate dikinase
MFRCFFGRLAAIPILFSALFSHINEKQYAFILLQDIEFTVQEGQLFMLQCRTGKRTGTAAMKFVCDFVDSGMATVPSALARMVEPRHLDQLLHPFFKHGKVAGSYGDGLKVLGKGLAASPGAAGQIHSPF